MSEKTGIQFAVCRLTVTAGFSGSSHDDNDNDNKQIICCEGKLKVMLSNFKFGFGAFVKFLSHKLSSCISDRLFWSQ